MAGPDTFFGSGLGDPRHLNERWAVQADNDVPASTGFHDCRSYGGTPIVTYKEVPRQVMTSAMMDTPLEGPMEIADSQREFGDFDTGNYAPMALLAALFRYYDHASVGDANTFTMSELGGTLAPQQFTNLVNEDTGLIKRYHSVMPKGFTLTAPPGGNLGLKITTVEGKMDLHGPSAQTAGTASTLPEFRLTMKVGGATADDALDFDIYLKVMSLISTTGAVVQAKVAAAGTYGSSFNVTFGTWTDIPTLGTRAEQPQVYWPVGATLTALDVFQVPKRRVAWTPSFPLFHSIALTQVRFYFNGYRLPLDGGLTVTVGVADCKRRQATERQAVGTQRYGPQAISVVLNREMVGLLFQKNLMDQTVNSLVIEAIGDQLIGASAVPYGATFICPALRGSGPASNVKAGGADRKEVLTLTASAAETPYTWNTVPYYADMSAVVTTGLTSLS